MAFTPTITWINGRGGGTRINASRLTAAFAECATYAESVAGGALVRNEGTIASTATLDITPYIEVLWIATLGANTSSSGSLAGRRVSQ